MFASSYMLVNCKLKTSELLALFPLKYLWAKLLGLTTLQVPFQAALPGDDFATEGAGSWPHAGWQVEEHGIIIHH